MIGITLEKLKTSRIIYSKKCNVNRVYFILKYNYSSFFRTKDAFVVFILINCLFYIPDVST